LTIVDFIESLIRKHF